MPKGMFHKLAVTVAASVLLTQGVPALAERDHPRPQKSAFNGVFPVVQGQGALTVAGKGYWHKEHLEDGDSPVLSAYAEDGSVLPNGHYRFEYRSVASSEVFAPGRSPLSGVKAKGRARPNSDIVSGNFVVEGGAITFK